MSGGARPDPKAPLAIDIWKRHATLIEANLAFNGLDIADWHQGSRDDRGRMILSSRKLLALLEHVPEAGGRWPKSLRMLKEVHTEIALYRAAKYVGGTNEYVPQLFLDPAEALDMVERKQVEDEQFDEATDELYESLDFT